MRQRLLVIVGFTLAALGGCQTVHSTREGAVPVAMWLSVVTEPHQNQVKPQTQEMVSDVLRASGLHPTLDESGVSVPDAEETRAREVLLTEKRLANSGVLVVLMVPAGTGRRTRAGVEVPAVAPREPMSFPTTTSTN